jgi:mannose-6-phosphate isomerase-like protein (cupin superfamily)
MTNAVGTEPTHFTIHDAPVLSEGNVQSLLAAAPSLWAHVKVYAEGGENGVHAHPYEDHMFLVLGGEATFIGAGEWTKKVGPYEGMLVPRGVHYAFKSSGSRNLVMVRIGAPTDTSMIAGTDGEVGPAGASGIPKAVQVRVALDGEDAPGLAPTNKAGAVPGVVVPGKTVGAPDWR